MILRERAVYIDQKLNDLYPNPPIPLDHKDPFTLLISVLLSAQCTDARVNLITPALFRLADNPLTMAQKKVDEINSIVRPCGLAPRKAKAIRELSSILIEKHEGSVPKSFDELEQLPGVGHKTASVVMSQAFDYPAFPVDTHIERCARRWGLSNKKSIRGVEEDLKAAFPIYAWNNIHLQIIYYARAYCPARRHRVDQCPICSMLNREG